MLGFLYQLDEISEALSATLFSNSKVNVTYIIFLLCILSYKNGNYSRIRNLDSHFINFGTVFIVGVRWVFCIHWLPRLCIAWFNWSDIKMLSWVQ